MPTNKATPINPAQARQKLDCLTRYREALELIAGVTYNKSLTLAGCKEIASEALKEESERL